MKFVVFNNGKGWLIGREGNHWIVYDENTNKFYPGWGTYYESKEKAEEIRVKLNE